jgi:hypothetical protein
VFQKELCKGIPNVNVWQVLRKRANNNVWNLIVKLFFKHPVLCGPNVEIYCVEAGGKYINHWVF